MVFFISGGAREEEQLEKVIDGALCPIDASRQAKSQETKNKNYYMLRRRTRRVLDPGCPWSVMRLSRGYKTVIS